MTNEVNNVKRPENWDQMFPGRFLKAGLLNDKKVTLTITDVILEKLPDEKKGEVVRGILCFKQTPFQLAINKTNGVCLRAMFGKKPLEWAGKRVTFQSELDNFGKDKVDAIRIYGSPDINEDIEVEIRMPKKKPKARKLFKVDLAGKNEPAPAPVDAPVSDTNGDA